MNTAEFLEITSAIVPEREALVAGAEGEVRVSYSELASRVNRLTSALAGLGVGKGQSVAVMALNCPEYVETYYACAKLGATFVPLNYRAKQEEIAYMVNDSEATGLFLGERYLEVVDTIRPELVTVKHLICYDAGPEGMRSFGELVQGAPENEVSVEVDDNDPTVLMYTSGTTAMPKGVVLTYGDFTAYVINTMEPASPEEPHNVTLLSVPLYHIAGATTMMSVIFGGRTLVMLPQFDPEGWLQATQRERVTHSFVVPTMLKRIMDHPDFGRYDLSSLQLVTYGAAPMPYEVVRQAVEVFRCGLMNAYGQTESTSTLTYLGPEDHRIEGSAEEKAKKLKRLASVGRAMPDVQVAIMNEAGEILPPGREGEIVARGDRVMKEYHKRASETSETLVGGWLHTGDVGYLDEEGYLFITGRKKDLIIRGGENISPGEVEAVLESHPAVAEAAVIAVPDLEWGEEVKAVVVLRRGQHVTAEELIRYTKERLASFKAPKYVEFVEELPRNYLGKVLKMELRKLYGQPVRAR